MKDFDIKKITIKDYRIIAGRMNVLYICVIGLLVVFVLYLLAQNSSLRTEMDSKIYVQVGNEIYNAVKTEKLSANLVRGFTDLAFSYLMNHDEYNYETNIQKAQSFFSPKSYHYIVSRFNTKSEDTEGMTLFEMYQTYDARMSCKVDKLAFDESSNEVMITATMSVVFEGKIPQINKVSFVYSIERISKNSDNPYGLQIYGLKPVKLNE